MCADVHPHLTSVATILFSLSVLSPLPPVSFSLVYRFKGDVVVLKKDSRTISISFLLSLQICNTENLRGVYLCLFIYFLLWFDNLCFCFWRFILSVVPFVAWGEDGNDELHVVGNVGMYC